MSERPHIPVIRAGDVYESLDRIEVKNHRSGAILAEVSQANAGLIRRDLRRIADKNSAFRDLSTPQRLQICREAGRAFMEAPLPLGDGSMQTPDEYVESLSATSGLPHTLCRKNMNKVFTVFDEMGDILSGLMRGMDPGVVDRPVGNHGGAPMSYRRSTDTLGVVLPSNSPGVNSIWMPAIALGIPVVLKPGREEPWTPMRIAQAFIAAGMPKEAFSLYPTDHEGAALILDGTGRSLLFGDESTTAQYASNPQIQLHGPGRSKVLIGRDTDWRDHLDVILASIADNGGRSCINASTIYVDGDASELAGALAERLAEITPLPADSPDARLAAFANPAFADWIDATIDQGLAESGTDVTASFREGSRRAKLDGSEFVCPTIILCDGRDHPLAHTEFMFPFASVLSVPHDEMVDAMGKSLVVTALTRDDVMIRRLAASPDVDRLNIGPIPTSHVEWDQPHEGNLFEFLFTRRAIQKANGWGETT